MDEPTIDEQVVIGETDDGGLNGGGGGGDGTTTNKEVKTENIAFDENISENAQPPPPRPVRANRASRNSGGGGGLSMATKSNLTPAKKSNKRPVVHIDTHWSSDEEEFAGFDVSSGMFVFFLFSIATLEFIFFITNRHR